MFNDIGTVSLSPRLLSHGKKFFVNEINTDGYVDVSLSICFQLFEITSVQSGFDVEGQLTEGAVEF